MKLKEKTKYSLEFFDLSLNMHCVANFEGQFIELNNEWTSTLGWSTAELCEKPYIEFVYDEDKENTAKETKSLSIGEHTVFFENRYKHKDGSHRWLSWTARSDLERKLIFATATDITEQKNIEEKNNNQKTALKLLSDISLYSNEAKEFEPSIKNILNIICTNQKAQIGHYFNVYKNEDGISKLKSSGLWYFENEERYLNFKKETEKIIFLENEGCPGKTYSEAYPQWFIFPEGKIECPRLNSIMLQNRLESGFSIPVWYKKNIIGVIEVFIEKRKEKDNFILEIGKLLGEQIGKIKERIDEYAQAELDFKNVYKIIDDHFILAKTTLSGEITYVNKNFCEISGYSKEELIGKDHRIVNSGFHKKEFFENMWKEILKGNVWKNEIQNKAKDGKKYWVETIIAPKFDLLGKIQEFVAIRFDITEKKEAQASLLQQEKMASLGEMAGGIAHEINNPLAIIQGKARKLKKICENNELNSNDINEISDKILNTITRIAKIISGLRSFARDGTKDNFEISNIDKIIQDTLDLCSSKIEKDNIKLIFIGAKESFLNVRCRAVQISQVLLNLLNNASDAIRDLEEKWIEIKITDLLDNIQIEITDSGNGIEPTLQDKIFEPFLTTKPVGKGTGLGLSVSKSIIEDHGGMLYIDKGSKNTKFIILLPKVL